MAAFAAAPAAPPQQAIEAERSVVVSGAGRGYFPVALGLADGRIAVLLRGGAPHRGIAGRLDVVFSEDEGKTWSEPTTVVDTPIDDRNPAFGQAANGTLVVGYWRTARYDDNGHYNESLLDKPVDTWVTRSADGGKTWSEPAQIDVADISWGSPYGRILTLPDGSMLMPVYGGPERPAGVRDPAAVGAGGEFSYLYRSEDNGQTWRRFSRIGADGFNETSVLRLPSGNLLAALRTAGKAEVWTSRSADGGKTWDEPTPLTPASVHPADLTLLGDGRVLLVSGNRAGPPFGVVGIVGDAEGKFDWEKGPRFVVSEDATNTDCGYPSSVLLNDGRVLTAYYAVGSVSEPARGEHCAAVVYAAPAAP